MKQVEFLLLLLRDVFCVPKDPELLYYLYFTKYLTFRGVFTLRNTN